MKSEKFAAAPSFFTFFSYFCGAMKHELSILIPIYNDICVQMVHQLSQQATAVEALSYEIIVADDGSKDAHCLQANSAIESLPHCYYIKRGVNVGRAAIRNFLAQQARYEWLLFLDGDMQVPHDHFLTNYLACDGDAVVDGGFAVVEAPSLHGQNLRYTYEWENQASHTAMERQKRPHQHFRTTNFMVRRDIMLQLPFDERIRHYGFEDVLFGKQLRQAEVSIKHIDNPMMLADVEPNSVFMAKTEEALLTLHTFRTELQGYSRLLTAVNGIHIGIVKRAIRLWHWLFGSLERRSLCGSKPRLSVFKLYKIGYYLTLTKNDKNV